MRRYVIGYPMREGKVLLIYKKRGLGKGLYNGVGGKVEDGETPEMAVRREAFEEIGIRVGEVEKVARIFFEDRKGVQMDVHVFLIRSWRGEERESEEAVPVWFDVDSLPYANMWEDDRIWLLRVLKGEKLTGLFRFNDIWGKEEEPRMESFRVVPGVC